MTDFGFDRNLIITMTALNTASIGSIVVGNSGTTY